MWTIDVFALSDFSRSESAKFLYEKILIPINRLT